MTSLQELANQEYNEAAFLYKKSIINRNLDYYFREIENNFIEYCKDKGLCFDDGQVAIMIEIFPQYDLEYCISIHLAPHKNTTKFMKKHHLPKNIVNWKFYPLTDEGITKLINDNKKILNEVAMYTNFDVLNLYTLSNCLNEFKDQSMLLTHKEKGRMI